MQNIQCNVEQAEKYVQFNVEVTFPLVDEYKVIGVVFYDRGDVYLDDENIDFNDQYSSAGAGVRWDSPVGPLRVEYAWVLDGKYVRCGHPESMDCNCYGKKHEGHEVKFTCEWHGHGRKRDKILKKGERP